jgi:hypothetical protein
MADGRRFGVFPALVWPGFLCCVLLQGVPAAAAATKFRVPDGAVEVRHVVLMPGRTAQDQYSIRLAFPSTAVLDHYRRELRDYIACEGRGQPWQGYGDAAAKQFFHLVIRHWVSRDNRELVTLGIRYASGGAAWRDRPDNDIQRVTVLHERVGNADGAARSQGSSCDGTPLPPPRPRGVGPFITP